MKQRLWLASYRFNLARAWKNFSCPQRLFLIIQIVIAMAAVWLWFHLQAPGWAVAMLAAVAAAMSIHADMRGWQKAIWMILIGSLLVIELRAINKDRKDLQTQAQTDRALQEKAFKNVRDQQNADFNATAQGLTQAYTQSQLQFAATMKRSGVILGKTSETVSNTSKAVLNITGGDSFAFVYPLMSSGDPVAHLSIHNGGKYSLSGVTVTIYGVAQEASSSHPCSLKFSSVTSRISMGSIAPNEGKSILPPEGVFIPFLRTDRVAHFRIWINAQNPTTTEDLYFRRAKDHVSFDYKLEAFKSVEGNPLKGDLQEVCGWRHYYKKTDWIEPRQQ